MAKVGWITSEEFLAHDTGAHPECAPRLTAIGRRFAAKGLDRRLIPLTPSPATDEDLERVHQRRHIARLCALAAQGGGALDADTVVAPASERVARLAAGAGITAARAIQSGLVQRVFCAVRPPGHHALPERAMGFCLYNNVAIAARWLLAAGGARRVLIVDFDVHHGNGTQAVFERDPSVWFLSMHQYPHYPMTGRAEERGQYDNIVNVPLPGGTPPDVCLQHWRQAMEDIAARSQPEWVLVSAGFDAHRADPLGGLLLRDEDFGALTDAIVAVANRYANGRILSLLEGGYDLDGLAGGAEMHVRALLED